MALGLGALVVAGCAPGIVYPPDVQHALARDSMRRAETEHLILYYPAHRRALAERVAARADRCAAELKAKAFLRTHTWSEKMTLVMPEVAFNNAYVTPKFGGSPDASVLPTFSTFDFTTAMGLLPDPGVIACHELVHYVHVQQIAGLWGALNKLFGDLYTPQAGFDPWFFEGLATHYEARLSPGTGRPAWPIFTGMFAAAYAGESIGSGELSEQGRRAPVGHHYLVGSMFVRFLVERYGEAAAWRAIADQGDAWLGLLSARTLRDNFGRSLDQLFREFNAWHHQVFPARARPAEQRRLLELGNDARYARGRDGTEAWISDDLDLPARLVVRDRNGVLREELPLAEILPPRRLAVASPALISGLSVTDDGAEVWFTAVDLGSISQTTRLLRWRAGQGLREVASGLGPGATVDGRGQRYFFAEVDGDRWSLAVYDVARRSRRVLVEASPGTYALGAQLSPDGRTLAASAWNGAAFALWMIDAQSGARLAELTGEGPLFDPAFLDDGRLVNLASVAGRFQVQLRAADGSSPQVISDAPYAVLAPRGHGGTVRFLNREGWSWTLDEIAVPAPIPPPTADPAQPATLDPYPAPAAPTTITTAPPSSSASAPAPAIAPAPPSASAPPSAVPPSASAGLPPASPLSAERPARLWDGLLTLHTPLVAQIVEGSAYWGVIIGGSDILGLHRWQLAGLGQLGYDRDNGAEEDTLGITGRGGLLTYDNSMLAPWTLSTAARYFTGVDLIEEQGVDIERERTLRDLQAVVSRSWRSSWFAAAGFLYTDDQVRDPVDQRERRKLGGPLLALSYSAGEATPYAGLGRAFSTALNVLHFPEPLSTLPRALTSARLHVSGTATLPFTRRHTLSLDLVARGLFPAEDQIELGGTSAFSVLWDRSSQEDPVEPDFATPPLMQFTESLRGYEDTLYAVSRVAKAELSWRYPLIIDRGLASLWILPASFVRQLDLEGFAAGALTDDASGTQPRHFAAGASATLRLTLFRVPLSLRYQLARRLTDDQALTQLFGIALAP